MWFYNACSARPRQQTSGGRLRGGISRPLIGNAHFQETKVENTSVRFFDDHSYYVGAMDNFEWDTDGNATLSGWGKLPSSNIPPDAILITDCTGRIICKTRCTEIRRDVSEYLSSESLFRSGWRAYIPKEFGKAIATNIDRINAYSYSSADGSAYKMMLYTHADEAVRIEENIKWQNVVGMPAPDRSKPYYSCANIESGIVFLENHVACMCCFSNLKADNPNDNILFSKTNDGDFNINSVLSKRREVIKANQGNGYGACKGCIHLRKRMWPAQKYFFNFLNIGHYASCNLSCSYCRLTLISKNPTDTPTDEIVQVIAHLQMNGCISPDSSIAITGGGAGNDEGVR